MRCQDCGRERPPCGFYPMHFIGGRRMGDDGHWYYFGGQLCWDCDAWRRAGRPPRITPSEELEAV